MALAETVLQHCYEIAGFTANDGTGARETLSYEMKLCHQALRAWMERLGMRVSVDAVSNLRGLYAGESAWGGRLIIGSHLDVAPNAGPFDGVLGVVLGIALVEALQGERMPYEIEVIGFAEENGSRFGTPFLGSRALAGRIDPSFLDTTDRWGMKFRDAATEFGVNPELLSQAVINPRTFAFLEFHIERGPILESQNKALGLVEAIVGRSRITAEFAGEPSNSGTTPMNLRRDAMCGAAEWIGMVEQEARSVNGLYATVEKMDVFPGQTGVIPSSVTVSLDVRHQSNKTLNGTLQRILEKARHVVQKRKLAFDFTRDLDCQAVPLNTDLLPIAERALRQAGVLSSRLVCGYGHDAMIVGEKVPSSLIFIRTPDGLAQAPGQKLSPGDIDVALSAGLHFLRDMAAFNNRMASLSANA